MSKISLHYATDTSQYFSVKSCTQVKLASCFYSHFVFKVILKTEVIPSQTRMLVINFLTGPTQSLASFKVIISKINIHHENGKITSELVLTSVLQKLDLAREEQLFTNQSAVDIALHIFNKFNLELPSLRINKPSTKYKYILQHRESSLAFLYRVLYKSNLYIFYEQKFNNYILTDSVTNFLNQQAHNTVILEHSDISNNSLHIAAKNDTMNIILFSQKTFAPFQIINLKNFKFIPYTNWVLVNTLYSFNTNSNKNIEYNKYILEPLEKFKLLAPTKLKGHITVAKIVGQKHSPQSSLDEQGFYSIEYMLGVNYSPIIYNIPKLEPYGGLYNNMHFPLLPGTKALIACINDDIDSPFILSAFFNQQYNLPQANANKSNNLIKSQLGGCIAMNDSQALLGIYSQTNKQHIILNNKQKLVQFNSKKNICINTHSIFKINSERKTTINAKNTSFHADKLCAFSANKVYLHTATLAINTKEHIHKSILTKINALVYSIKAYSSIFNSYSIFLASTDNYQLCCLKHLHMRAKKKVLFKAGNSALLINNGKLHFKSMHIQMKNVANTDVLLPYKSV